MKYPPFTYRDCEIKIETQQQTDGKWHGKAFIKENTTKLTVEVFPPPACDVEADAFQMMLNRVVQEVGMIRDPAVIEFI